MRKFIIHNLQFLSILLIIYGGLLIFVYFVSTEPKLPFEFLYQYQRKKIQSKGKYHTIFIGDSSLGNAIDSDFYSNATSNKSINLALTGAYGYAGSYNILKKSIQYHPEIKNVVLMQSLDTLCRSTSYKGYLYTMDSINDYYELSFNEKVKLIPAAIDIRDELASIIH